MERTINLSPEASRALIEGLRGAAVRFSRELGWNGVSAYPFSSILREAAGCAVPLAEGNGFSVARPMPDGVVFCPLTFDEGKGVLVVEDSYFPKVDFSRAPGSVVQDLVSAVSSMLMNGDNVQRMRGVTVDGTLPVTLFRNPDGSVESYSAHAGSDAAALAVAVEAFKALRCPAGGAVVPFVSGTSREPFRYDGAVLREVSYGRHRDAMTDLSLMMAEAAAKRNQSANGRFAGADVKTGRVDVFHDRSSCALSVNGEVVFCAFLDVRGSLVVSGGSDYDSRPETPSRICVVGEKSGSQKLAEDALVYGSPDERQDVLDAIRDHVEGIVLSKESCEAYGEACDRMFDDIGDAEDALHALAFLSLYYDREAAGRIDSDGLSEACRQMTEEMPFTDAVGRVMQHCRMIRPGISGIYAEDVERRVITALRGIYNNLEKKNSPGV